MKFIIQCLLFGIILIISEAIFVVYFNVCRGFLLELRIFLITVIGLSDLIGHITCRLDENNN